jgi:hypothetical protein
MIGRPSAKPLIDAQALRIDALEARLALFLKGEPEPAAGVIARVALLERQVAAMNEAFNRGAIPRPSYESQFRVWPGANPQANGST